MIPKNAVHYYEKLESTRKERLENFDASPIWRVFHILHLPVFVSISAFASPSPEDLRRSQSTAEFKLIEITNFPFDARGEIVGAFANKIVIRFSIKQLGQKGLNLKYHMNRILKQISILLLSLGTSFHAFGQAAPAAPAPQQQPDQISQLAEMVGLSDEQESNIRQVVDETSPKIDALQMQAQGLQVELSELAGPDFDEATIREKASELGDLQGEMTALSIILQSKVDSIFTDEQRQKLEDMQRQQQQMQQMQQQQMQQQIQQQMQQQMQQQQQP